MVLTKVTAICQNVSFSFSKSLPAKWGPDATLLTPVRFPLRQAFFVVVVVVVVCLFVGGSVFCLFVGG